MIALYTFFNNAAAMEQFQGILTETSNMPAGFAYSTQNLFEDTRSTATAIFVSRASLSMRAPFIGLLLFFAARFVSGSAKPKFKLYENRALISFLTSIFCFISIQNFHGLFIAGYSQTATIVVTTTIGLTLLLWWTLIGLSRNSDFLLSFFLPMGAPVFLILLIIPIELISFSFRLISISLRLFTNIMAGHALLKIFAGFVFTIGSMNAGIWANVSFILVGFITAMSGLEIIIAFLQAYVFITIAMLYYSDMRWTC